MERILEANGIQYYYPLLSDKKDIELSVIKLHGSLNWQTDTGATPLISTLSPSQTADIDYGIGWYRQPEVIGPTFFKQEITFDIQRDERATYYKKLWRNAWNTLLTARNIVFVGFSFPRTDFHASALFKTACLRKGRLNRKMII